MSLLVSDTTTIAEVLRRCMAQVQAEGIRLCQADYGVYYDVGHWRLTQDPPAVDPLGAVIWCHRHDMRPGDFARGYDDPVVGALAYLLGIDEEWCLAFADGFDGYPHLAGDPDEAYQLGQQLRAEGLV